MVLALILAIIGNTYILIASVNIAIPIKIYETILIPTLKKYSISK